jgi:signal transduction histidine kinase
MAALPPTTPSRRAAAADSAAAESAFEATVWDQLIQSSAPPARWRGARLRILLAGVLLAVLALAWLAGWLATEPTWRALWRAQAPLRVELVTSSDPALQGLAGRTLVGWVLPGGERVPVDAMLLQHAARWIVDDADRERHIEQQQQLVQALAVPGVVLEFEGGRLAQPQTTPRGLAGLGSVFWVMAALALTLGLTGLALLLLQPTLRSGLYQLMCAAQAGNLLFVALESLPGLALPSGLAAWDLPARASFDLVTAAAIVQATGSHPRPVRHRRSVATASWLIVATLVVLLVAGRLPQAWWWTQLATIALGLLVLWQLGRAEADEPHPLAALLRRFGVVVVGTLALLTLALAANTVPVGGSAPIASAATLLWAVFMATTLLAVPLLSRPPRLVREFALLAGVSTLAVALHLLLVALLSLDAFAALALTMFVTLGLYVAIRQWILEPLLGSTMLTTERMFEQLYRSAREVRAHPERLVESVSPLLRELFEPLQVLEVARETERARVISNGATLLVPLPRLTANESAAGGTVVLRYAHRGRRLFTPEDALLTDRVLEQLRRAVDYDRAVEQGRSEERVRIAQDLHDDIGARLLTLMYQAPTPEVEDYVRHTLQDLKTLTRGLAAPTHRLSHAAAEWKTDITQRLAAAQCELGWSFSADRDIVLTVVQWSALTRVLRELVSNAIVHAHAGRVEIDAVFYGGRLTLTVSDNGVGRDPQAWAHGLGLGGVRKRIKQLGGSVEWRENHPGPGVRCEVAATLNERR